MRADSSGDQIAHISKRTCCSQVATLADITHRAWQCYKAEHRDRSIVHVPAGKSHQQLLSQPGHKKHGARRWQYKVQPTGIAHSQDRPTPRGDRPMQRWPNRAREATRPRYRIAPSVTPNC
jgi:hypothetical protein